MRTISKAVAAAGLAAATVISGLSFGSAAATAAPATGEAKLLPGTEKAAKAGETFQLIWKKPNGSFVFVSNDMPGGVSTSNTLAEAKSLARPLEYEASNGVVRPPGMTWKCMGMHRVGELAGLLGGLMGNTFPCGTSNASFDYSFKWDSGQLVPASMPNWRVGSTVKNADYTYAQFVSGPGWEQQDGYQSNGGFDAVGVGAAASIVAGSTTAVTFGAKVNTTVTSMTGTTTTVKAPAGTTFPNGTTTLRGQYLDATDNTWKDSDSLRFTGSLSSDRKTFTGTMTNTGAGFKLNPGNTARWIAPIEAPDDAAGSSKLDFTVSGTTNAGAFSFAGNSPVTISKSAITAVDLGPIDLPRGQSTKVPFGVHVATNQNDVNGTVVLTAPEGTTFPAQANVAGQYKNDGTSTWNNDVGIGLTNGVVSNSGKTLTLKAAWSGQRGGASQQRYFVDVTTPSDATAGDKPMQFTFEGTAKEGPFRAAGSTSAAVRAADGGFDAKGVGTPLQIDGGERKAATIGAEVTGRITSMTGTNVTLTAPADVTFPSNQTTVTGQFKKPGGEWTTTDNLLIRGTASADGSKFTGTISSTSSSFDVPSGTQIRWTPDVQAAANAKSGSGDLDFAVAGTTNIGGFSVTGKSPITVRSTAAALTVVPGVVDHIEKKVTLSGTATAGANIFVGDTRIGTADSEGKWKGTVSGLTTGTQTITVVQKVGNTFIDDKDVSVTVIEGGTIVPGTTDAVELQRGASTDVPFIVQNKQNRTDMVGTVELTAPAGTTFADGQTTVSAQYRSGDSGSWTSYAKLDLRNGTLNADKTKLTFALDTDGGNMLAGEQYRYVLKVNAPADAAAGESKMGYVYQGTSSQGSYSATGSTTTKLADVSDPAELVVETPANGSTVTVKRPVFSGTGEPGAAIEISGSTKVVATTTVDPEGNWTADANFDLVDGNYNLTAKQSPVGGTPSTASVKFTVKTAETIAPVRVTSPAAGSITDDRTPTFTGTGHNGAKITVRGSQTVLDTATVVDGKWELTSKVSLPNGDYDLYVDQTVQGKTTTIRHKITVNNPLTASIKVVTPKQGTPLTEVDTLRPTFTGTATPGAAISVGSSRTTIATGNADARGNWTATATSDLAAGGTYNLTAKQTKGGKESTTPAAFTVSSKASSIRPIVLTAPAQNATVDTVRPTFTGTATPNAKITVGSSRTTIASGTADDQGKFSFTTDVDLERGGTYTGLTVRQVTTDDRTSTTTSSFVVAKDADADKLTPITVSSPAKDEVVKTVRPTFVGTATPGAKITIGSSKTTVATGDADESGAFSILASIDLKPGVTYTNLGVKQEKGGVSNSTTISFSVAKDADTGKLEQLTVSSPAQNEVVDTVRPTFVGKATPGASIRVHSSKTTVASGTADSKGDFSIQAQADLARGGTYAGLTVTQQKGSLTDSSTKISFSVAKNAS